MLKLFPVLIFLFFISCSKEGPTPAPAPAPPPPPPPVVVNAGFNLSVSGDAPSAAITLVNNSTGADTYKWTFSEGASMDSSDQATPSGITVDKKGDFTVTLVASKGNVSQTLTKTVTIGGTNPILVYTDVKFGVHNQGTLPYCFSVAENKFYQRSEINATTGPKIDLVFWKDGLNSVTAFLSPHEPLMYEGFVIPGAKTTAIMNNQSTVQLSPEQFDAPLTDENLEQLTIINHNSIILANSQYLPKVVLFKTAEGRNGAIKIKTQEADHLLVDIKVQKY